MGGFAGSGEGWGVGDTGFFPADGGISFYRVLLATARTAASILGLWLASKYHHRALLQGQEKVGFYTVFTPAILIQNTCQPTCAYLREIQLADRYAVLGQPTFAVLTYSPMGRPEAGSLFALSIEPICFLRGAAFSTEKVNRQTAEWQLGYGEALPDALPVFFNRAGFQPVAEICKYQTAE